MEENVQTQAPPIQHPEFISPQPMPPQFQPIVPKRQRRVGTITLGLTMILIGVMIPLTMIFKDKAIFILQFSPIVLVMLGIEVLIYAFKYKEGKLNYDGFSVFLVIMLTIVSIGAASITPLITTYVKNEKIVNTERNIAETSLKKALRSNGITASVYTYPQNSYYPYDNSLWIDEYYDKEVFLSATVNILWENSKKMPTEQEIKDKLSPVLKEIDFRFDEITFDIVFGETQIAVATIYGDDLHESNLIIELNQDGIHYLKSETEGMNDTQSSSGIVDDENNNASIETSSE